MAITRIIEETTGIPYHKYLEQTIISKLPFHGTTVNSTKDQLSGHLAEGFSRVARNVSESEGGLGFLGNVYEPAAFFVDEEREAILAGVGDVVMSGHDAVCSLSGCVLEGSDF